MTVILTQAQSINELVFDNNNTVLTFPVTSYQIVSKNIQGPRGPQGADGQPGMSAYEVAVDNGFVGTEPQWLDSLQASSLVTSVNGQIGDITISKSSVGLSNVDNTADLSKPISTATQSALDSKANVSHTHSISNITNLQTVLDDKQQASVILTNTTASFTTAAESKLGSIESNAQVNNVFISDTQPTTPINKYMWIDTSGGNLTFWIEDGT